MTPNSLTIRDATPADLPAIIAMLADDPLGKARETASDPVEPAYSHAFDAIVADPNQRLIVAEQHGAIVGTLQLSFLPGLSYRGAWRGQIEGVRVASDQRGSGLGTQLINWAIDLCLARDCRFVQLTTHNLRTDAHRFYDRLGFVQSHAGMKLDLSKGEQAP